MFVEESKKVFSAVHLQDLLKGGLNHYILCFGFPVFHYFLLAVDKLLSRYIYSWQDVAHDMASLRKIYYLMLITLISAFQWTVEVAWL